ncbi:hypothetical protein OIO90_004073 [Microbotryomycetes sp. JL221]|nr:hypothetical protein OIO90_004073 [Microbotryomycetes sp. JL221]
MSSQPMVEFRRTSVTTGAVVHHHGVEFARRRSSVGRMAADDDNEVKFDWRQPTQAHDHHSLGRSSRRTTCRPPAIVLCTIVALVVLAVVWHGKDERTEAVARWWSNEYARDRYHNVKVPQWHDFNRIKQRTPRYNGVTKQLKLTQLDNVKEPFNEVYVTSAWIDTRPLVVPHILAQPRLPQLTFVSSIKGAKHMSMPDGLFNDNILKCYVVMRHRQTRDETILIEQAQLQGLPDPHEWDTDLVSVKFSCPIKADWQDSDIYATLSTDDISPPSDVFVPVTPLPILDQSHHVTGQGTAAVCLPALINDLYAPLLEDFIAYYKTLGFNQIYAYLLDPGTHSLAMMRDFTSLKRLQSTVKLTPIRFGLHKGLKKSVSNRPESISFQISPSDWNIKGIDVLQGDDEFELTGLGNPTAAESDIRTWYYGQGLALHDCQYRAMKDGHRWITAVDWDEFLVLKPDNQQPWPVMQDAERGGERALQTWLRTASTRWTWPFTIAWQEAVERLGVDVAAISQRNMPPAYLFQSSFACIRCTPEWVSSKTAQSTGSELSGPDESNESVQELKSLVPNVANSGWTQPGPGLMLPMMSPIRANHWFAQNLRSKTLVDPWAWWSLGIHSPGVGFAEWMVQRGPCATLTNIEQQQQCAKTLIEAFGWGTALVAVPQQSSITRDTSFEQAQFGSNTLPKQAQGGLYHFRVDPKLTKAMVRFYDEVNEQLSILSSSSTIDILEGQEGVELVGTSRVAYHESKSQYGDDSIELTQDWTMLHTMGKSLIPVFEAKRKFGPRLWVTKVGHKVLASATSTKQHHQRMTMLQSPPALVLVISLWALGGFLLFKMWRGRSRARLR